MAATPVSLLEHLAEVHSITEYVKLQPTALILLQKRRLIILDELCNAALADEAVCRDAEFITRLFSYLKNRDYAHWSYQECSALANLVALAAQACKSQKSRDLHPLAADCLAGLKEYNAETKDASLYNLLASLCLQRQLFLALGMAVSSLFGLTFLRCLAALKALKSNQATAVTRACILECLALMQVILQQPPKYTNQEDRSAFTLLAREFTEVADPEIAFEAFRAYWATLCTGTVGKKELKDILACLNRSTISETAAERNFAEPAAACLRLALKPADPKAAVITANIHRMTRYTFISHRLAAIGLAAVLGEFAMVDGFIIGALHSLTPLKASKLSFCPDAFKELILTLGLRIRSSSSSVKLTADLLKLADRTDADCFRVAILQALSELSAAVPSAIGKAHFLGSSLVFSKARLVQDAAISLVAKVLNGRPGVLAAQCSFLLGQLKGNLLLDQVRQDGLALETITGTTKLLARLAEDLIEEFPDYCSDSLVEGIICTAQSQIESFPKSLRLVTSILGAPVDHAHLISIVLSKARIFPPEELLFFARRGLQHKLLEAADVFKIVSVLAELSNRDITELSNAHESLHTMLACLCPRLNSAQQQSVDSLLAFSYRVLAFCPDKQSSSLFADFAALFWKASTEMQSVCLMQWSNSIAADLFKTTTQLLSACTAMLASKAISIRSATQRLALLESFQAIGKEAVRSARFEDRIKCGRLFGNLVSLIDPSNASELKALSDQITQQALEASSPARVAYIIAFGTFHGRVEELSAFDALGLLGSIARGSQAGSETKPATLLALCEFVKAKHSSILLDIHWYQELLVLIYGVAFGSIRDGAVEAAILELISQLAAIVESSNDPSFHSLWRPLQVLNAMFSAPAKSRQLLTCLKWTRIEHAVLQASDHSTLDSMFAMVPVNNVGHLKIWTRIAETRLLVFEGYSSFVIRFFSDAPEGAYQQGLDFFLHSLRVTRGLDASVMTDSASSEAVDANWSDTAQSLRITRIPVIVAFCTAVANGAERLGQLPASELATVLQSLLKLIPSLTCEHLKIKAVMASSLNLLNELIVRYYRMSDALSESVSLLEFADAQILFVCNAAIHEGFDGDTGDVEYAMRGYQCFFNIVREKLRFSPTFLKESRSAAHIVEGAFEALRELAGNWQDVLPSRVMSVICGGVSACWQLRADFAEAPSYDQELFLKSLRKCAEYSDTMELSTARCLLDLSNDSTDRRRLRLTTDRLLEKGALVNGLELIALLAEMFPDEPVSSESFKALRDPTAAELDTVANLIRRIGWESMLEQWAERCSASSESEALHALRILQHYLQAVESQRLSFDQQALDRSLRLFEIARQDERVQQDPELARRLMMATKSILALACRHEKLQDGPKMLSKLVDEAASTQAKRKAFLVQLCSFGLCTQLSLGNSELFEKIEALFEASIQEAEGLEYMQETWILFLKALTKPEAREKPDFAAFVDRLTVRHVKPAFAVCKNPDSWRRTLETGAVLASNLVNSAAVHEFVQEGLERCGNTARSVEHK